jgi:hypothetical protein
MKVNEIIVEGATDVLYHYTSTHNAARVLKSGDFELSSVVGNKSEEQYAPPGYPYFFSTTRSRVGDYHRYAGSSAVMFVLNGQWLQQRYKIKPIDYWERSWQHSPDRTRESEDRVFSKQPSIPIGCVTAIHVLLKEKMEYRSALTRDILIAGKTRGIPTYLYTDEQAWRLQDTRKAVRPAAAADKLKGDRPRGHVPSYVRVSPLEQWLELIYKKNKSELSPAADRLRHNLIYYGSRYPNEDGGLGAEMSNARKPSEGEHQFAVKIIDIMKRMGAKTTTELKNVLVTKWDSIK